MTRLAGDEYSLSCLTQFSPPMSPQIVNGVIKFLVGHSDLLSPVSRLIRARSLSGRA
jgi:hypothetical protein